ncbi:MAG: glycosyltransferase family 4 protein [Microbacteriaceae bacterium]
MNQVKIIFDCRYVRLERHDGISRYTVGMVAELAKLHPVTMMIYDKRQLDMLPDLPWVMGPSPRAITEPLAALYFNRYSPDIVYTPMQTMGPWGRRFALVTTVHDLIYYSNRTPPRNLAWPVRIIWRLYHLSWAPQRGLLRRADAHVAVSETTRELMIRHRLTPHPITVVRNGLDAVTAEPRLFPAGHDLIYMGSFMPYKNVEMLARAMHSLPGYRLHLMSQATTTEQHRLAALAPAGALQFHDGASDQEYAVALSQAVALVTASRNEGFGLPLVEAMSVGTPVIVSDIPVFREVGGVAPLYFAPDSVDEFVAAVQRLGNPEEWRRRSTLSLAASEPYRWDASARILLTLLTKVYASRDSTAF